MASPNRSHNKKVKEIKKPIEVPESNIALPTMGVNLSTASEVAVNNNVKQWLDGTRTPSVIEGRPTMQNQENFKASDTNRPNSVDGSRPGSGTLASRPLSALRQHGIGAPNTPQAGNSAGNSAGTMERARSAGDANGRRPYLGTRANTSDGGSLQDSPVARFQAARFQLGLTQRPASGQSPRATDRLGNSIPGNNTANIESSTRCAILAPSAQVLPLSSSAVNTSVSGVPTTAVSTFAGYPIGTPAFSGNIDENFVMAPNALELIHPSEARRALERSIGRTPPLVTHQQLQQEMHQLIVSPPTAPGVVDQNVFHSPIVQPIQDIVAEGIRLRVQDRAASRRPESRRKRIKRDLKQLWKDLFGHNPDVDSSMAQLSPHSENELQTVAKNGHQKNVGQSPVYQNSRMDGSTKTSFSKRKDRRAETEANGEPQDRKGTKNSHPTEGITATPNERTLSEASSGTAREGSSCDPPKTIFRRISAMMKPKPRDNNEVRIRRRNVTFHADVLYIP